MKSKLDKLNELGELLQSGAITQEEFNNLKSEILNPKTESKENPKLAELRELLESATITQDEFNSLEKELTNKNEKITLSKFDPSQYSSEEKTINKPAGINRKLSSKEQIHKAESQLLKMERELEKRKKQRYNKKIYRIILFVFVAMIVLYKIIPVDSENINNFSEERNSNSSSTINNPKTKPNIIGHIRNSNFSVNGNGNVYFSVNSKRPGARNITGTVTVSGGRATLQGEISILTDYSLMIYNLKAVSGSYDASINAGSTGVFYLQSNGNLEGTLSAKGETRNVKFVYEN